MIKPTYPYKQLQGTAPSRMRQTSPAIGIFLCEKSERGDIILLAGKGHEKYQLINGKNTYFCEREILEDYINELMYSTK